MNENMTIFDIIYPKYKITKPIRLIEFFAGYGSQALALKYLGVPFEHWKICEWAIKSIQAYKDIHFTNDDIDYSRFMTKEDLIEKLFDLGISSNYNEPMTKQQITKLNEELLKKIWDNIKVTNNLVNIQQVKGKDLEIVDTDKYDYILTYSFPCQDLSLAGKGKGMSDTSTRSGMLWEVERILTECYELRSMPQILLMENVPQVHGTDNVVDFNKWQLRLEELGYKNYLQDLIATDYGIPQTRNRCFMISILGDYSYSFPPKQELKLKLKDMLEDNVEEKYYLSDKQIKDNQNWNAYEKPLETIDNENSKTLTTRIGAYCSSMQLVRDNLKIKNATKQGYLEATYGDGIDLAQPNSQTRRGRVQKNSIQTLTTQNNLGVCIGTYQYAKSDNFMQGKDRLQLGKEVSDTIQTTQKEGIVNSDLRIRKLTPFECFTLMGVKRKDYEKCAKNQSDSSLYHLAGDSIVVNVLMAIFRELM